MATGFVTILKKAPIGRLINYIILFYSILQLAISRFLIAFDGYGRILMCLVALSLFFNFNNRNFYRSLKCTPICIWWLWCIYVTITTLYFGCPIDKLDSFGFLFNYVYMPAFCMTIACMEANDSPKDCLYILLTAFSIYVLSGIALTSVSGHGRGGVELGNSLPLTSMAMVGLAAFAATKKWINQSTLLAFLALALIATIFVATRKAMVGIAFIMFFYFIGKYNISKPKNVVILVFIAIVSILVVQYILDATLIGERFDKVDKEARKWNPHNDPFLSMVGDRAFFYVVGYELFQHCNKFIGVGLLHFPKLAHTHLPLHTEYMVQLLECGYIGCTLFLSFIISFFRKIRQYKYKYKQLAAYRSSFGWLIAFLFICFTAWTYQFSYYFIVFGFILGCLPSSMRQKRLN